MGKELKVIPWERSKWQEAFSVGRGKFICPTCGEEVKAGKPWGIAIRREERDVPRDQFPGLVIHTCPVCNIPFLRPKRKEVLDGVL
jgi:hypothetical protein